MGGVPEVHLDYMFMGEEQEAGTLAMLVARERDSKATMTTVVPRKGVDGWVPKRIGAWMKELGLEHQDVVVKSDNEPALVALVELWGRFRAARGGGKLMVEHSPVGSSKSNGLAEKAVQDVQGMIRTMRSALEDKWGVKMSIDHPAWAWLVEYAAFLWTRFNVSKGGKTAYERLKGKRAKVHGIEFGEGVKWKRRREGGPSASWRACGRMAYTWELKEVQEKSWLETVEEFGLPAQCAERRGRNDGIASTSRWSRTCHGREVKAKEYEITMQSWRCASWTKTSRSDWRKKKINTCQNPDECI